MADILDRLDEMNESGVIAYDVYSELHDLASQLEERKAGKWIELTNKTGTVITLRCNCCGKSPKYAIRSLYCPNCGAEMKGGKNE